MYFSHYRAFDVGDVDEAASSSPELNFIIEHVGLP
jgi:predicted TIM-barrel fold metal-dependent hydrolase